MHILAIDIGSYSVKYISSFVERRRVSHADMSEIIIRDYLADHEGISEEEAKTNIVHEIIDSVARTETRILFPADNEIMTTRFLTLPVKSKKKAELMLPFQLEEDIPYSLNEIHYAYRMEGQKTQHVAIVELVNRVNFQTYFDNLKEKNILPSILTSEASIVENYFNIVPMAGPFCILDIGHKTSKAYFFYNSRLIVAHVCYMGGHHINEMIAQTYQQEMDEAIFYKHQNAFLLTSTQHDEVDQAQREFAGFMDKVFQPLVQDFNRWKIGFKVNFGINLSAVYLCGGTSNVKNVANYLTEKWEVKVSLLETFDQIEGEKIDLNPKNKSKFALVNMLAIGFKKKNRFINLLNGRFAQASLTEFPLHSMAFIGVRVAALATLLAISLIAERIFIERDINQLNSQLSNVIKKDELAISGRLRRMLTSNPKQILDSLIKRQKSVHQEISTLQSAVEMKALSPLVTIGQIAGRTDATMTHFSTTNLGEIKVTFTAEKIDTLKSLKDFFETSSLKDLSSEINQQKLQLNISAGM